MARFGAMVMAATLLSIGVTGCARPEAADNSPLEATGTASAASPVALPDDQPGPTYVLPAKLCAAVDQASLAEVFPLDGGQPIADAPGHCATSRASEMMAVSLSVDAELLPDPEWAKRFYDTGRRLARETPTDIFGAGSAAFWTGDQNQVKLLTYHGNLALTITCETVNGSHQLPTDLPARLARLAAGTYGRLTA